jgi:hypothetical protein
VVDVRDVFSEYYLPDDEQEAAFLREAVVVVDTNLLLSLYRMTAHERDQQLDALAKVADRLWIPYQVGWEFQRNRMKVIKERAGRYNTLGDVPSAGTAEAMRDEVRGLKLPADVTAEIEALLGPLTAQLDEVVAPFAEKARELAAKHVIDPGKALRHDPVRDRLDELFAGRVGAKPEGAIRDGRVVEARERTARKKPPGFKDQNKGDDLAKAGDYLLWAELLDHARGSAGVPQAFLFVTGDEKEDWFVRDESGQPTGPRVELIVEFAAANPHGYHQITHARFLELAQRHLGVTVDADTIARADSIAKEAASVDTAWAGRGVTGWLEAKSRRQMGTPVTSGWSDAEIADLQGAAARRWLAAASKGALRGSAGGSGDALKRYLRGAAAPEGDVSESLNRGEAFVVHQMREMFPNVVGASELVQHAYLTTALHDELIEEVPQPVEGHPEVSAAFVEAVAVAVAFVPRSEAGSFVRAQIEAAHPGLSGLERDLLAGIVLLRASVPGGRNVHKAPEGPTAPSQ